MELVGFDSPRLLIRYPGYVRAADTLACLDDRFLDAVDSSDLYEIRAALPAFPYRLIAERNGQLRRTSVTEIPCVWIDKLLRTRDQRKLHGLAPTRSRAFPGSVMSFVTHTKVLGAAWGHCHVYLHDPLRGMAVLIVEESWNRFGRVLG